MAIKMRDFTRLSIELRPSRCLLIGGGLGHGLAGITIVISATPLWVKAGLIISVVLSLVRFGVQYGYPRGHGFVARLERLDGRWRIETGDGQIKHARLISGYAHPNLVILNFRLQNNKQRSLTLLPDATDAHALRQLRVLLRTQTAMDEPNP